mmetsp:Transcript_2646/g.5043  ORF Transcript_2646/g.5043 Transcript_2646/m.5043 type:complete len:148 (-) Transcript_2646:4-447(-)
MSTVEEIQRAQNEEVMEALQVEMMMEASREEKLAKVTDPDERVQLEELFAIQRDNCQARIAILREKHREVLNEKVKKLVKYKKSAVKMKGKPPIVKLEVKPGSPLLPVTGGNTDGLETETAPAQVESEEGGVEDVKPVDFFKNNKAS